MRFDRFTIVLLYRNEDGPHLTDEEATALQDAHLEHLAALHEAGRLIAAGPTALGNPEEVLRGVCIFNTGVEEARAIEQDDPSVRAGAVSITCLPWMVPAGAISHTSTRFPRSVAEAAPD